jgi:hypothetical protein
MTGESSAGAPEFQRSAEDLEARLGVIGTAESMGMAREAHNLADTFRSWEKRRPANDTRILAIRQLFELNRRVMDYLAHRSKPAKR